jgi:hypothetical protein
MDAKVCQTSEGYGIQLAPSISRFPVALQLLHSIRELAVAPTG